MLRSPEPSITRELLEEIDVMVINYRPDVPAKLGLDYETVRKIKPDII